MNLLNLALNVGPVLEVPYSVQSSNAASVLSPPRWLYDTEGFSSID